MCGRATLAIAVSSSSMKVARVTVMAMSHGLMRGAGFGLVEREPESCGRGEDGGLSESLSHDRNFKSGCALAGGFLRLRPPLRCIRCNKRPFGLI